RGLVGPAALERDELRILAAGGPRRGDFVDGGGHRAVGTDDLHAAGRTGNLAVDPRATREADGDWSVGVDGSHLGLFDRDRAGVVGGERDGAAVDLGDLAD